MDEIKYGINGTTVTYGLVKEESNTRLEYLINKLRDIREKLLEDAESPEDVHKINQFIAAGVALAKDKNGSLDFDELNNLLHMFLFEIDDSIS